MHTQRQSYLFKNRSRSPQFSQATQRDKSHQYRSTKTCRSPCVLFFDSFLSIPGNSPFISFSISTSLSVYPCCCETNILLVFSSKSSSGQCLFFFFSSHPPLYFPPDNQFHFDCFDECIPPHYVLPLRGR